MTERLSTTAQLVRLLMKHEGIISTAALARETGLSERRIWQAKSELKQISGGLQEMSVQQISPPHEAGCRGPEADFTVSVKQISVEPLACAGATKESLRDKSSLVESEVKGSEDIPPTPSLPAVAEPTIFGEVIAPEQSLVVAKPKRSRTVARPAITDLDALTAFERYNDLAQRIGLHQASSLTPRRRKSLKARLAEHDGLAGWDEILASVERSSFLRGGGDRGWKADLEFLLQAKSCAKVRDGSYGNGAGHESQISRMLRRFATTDEVHA